LVPEPWKVPDTYAFGGETLVPLRAGAMIGWRLAEVAPS
jgi:dihydroorotase